MEYEIADQERLFDPSTNPSLQHRKQRPVWPPARMPNRSDPLTARKVQKAVLIPEEEQPA